MAQLVVIGNQTYKKRNVVAVWLGLPLITLGIYPLVWIYKVNDEARRFLGDNSIRPALSVLAFLPGGLLIVPPFIAIYRLGTRIARMEAAAGSSESSRAGRRSRARFRLQPVFPVLPGSSQRIVGSLSLVGKRPPAVDATAGDATLLFARRLA